MTVRQTSLEAYQSVKLAKKQQEIYKACSELGYFDDWMLAKYLGWTINRVTPRRLELAKFGLIIEAGFSKNENNRRVITWKCLT